MQIHIWQQFSSNHSASFEVVGKFESQESAQHAAARINEMFKTIEHWLLNSQDSEYRKRRQKSPDSKIPPTPPEIAFGEEYGVDWSVGIRWLLAGGDGWRDPVLQYRNLVIIRPRYTDTWQGPQSLDQILIKLGATNVGIFQEEVAWQPDKYLLATITFTALDESTAQNIQTQLEQKFQSFHDETYDDVPEVAIPFDYFPDLRQRDFRYYELERNGLDFVMYGVMFFDTIDIALRSVIDYLEAKDCYNIDYNFQSILIDPQE